MAELVRDVARSTDQKWRICDAGGIENSHANLETVCTDGSVMDNRTDVVHLTRATIIYRHEPAQVREEKAI